MTSVRNRVDALEFKVHESPSGGEILEACLELAEMLLDKNKAYGDSALNPVRIFSRASASEQIRVRLDDKLSRLARGFDAGEDVIGDLLGYLVLLVVQSKRDAEVSDRGGEAVDGALRAGGAERESRARAAREGQAHPVAGGHDDPSGGGAVDPGLGLMMTMGAMLPYLVKTLGLKVEPELEKGTGTGTDRTFIRVGGKTMEERRAVLHEARTAGVQLPREGLCQDCSKPSGDAVLCRPCYEAKGFRELSDVPSEGTSEWTLIP